MKLYFFDFDRTLCSHDYVRKAAGDLSYMEECLYCLDQQTFREEHGKDAPLACMQWYVREKLRQKNSMCFALTHEVFNLRDAYKQDFIKRNYGGMGYLTVDKPEHKIDMIMAMAKYHNVELCDCELVDDKTDTVYLACSEGINGRHLSDIVREHDLYLMRKAWED